MAIVEIGLSFCKYQMRDKQKERLEKKTFNTSKLYFKLQLSDNIYGERQRKKHQQMKMT